MLVNKVARIQDLNASVVLALKGVTVSRHPAARAASGEPNHRRYIWIGLNGGFMVAFGNSPLKTNGAGALPGATVNVSIMKRQ